MDDRYIWKRKAFFCKIFTGAVYNRVSCLTDAPVMSSFRISWLLDISILIAINSVFYIKNHWVWVWIPQTFKPWSVLFEFLKQLFNHQCPFVHSSVSPSESKTHKHLKFNYSATLSTTIITTFTTNIINISITTFNTANFQIFIFLCSASFQTSQVVQGQGQEQQLDNFSWEMFGNR